MRADELLALGGRALARRTRRRGIGLLALASAIAAWWSWRTCALIEASAPPHPTDRVLPLPSSPFPSSPFPSSPPSSPRAREAQPAPVVLVKIRGDLVRHRAQVRIGARTVTVGELREVLVPAGAITLRWREHERAPWRAGGVWRLEPGTAVMAFVSAAGPRLRTLP